ncbi:hypothetical protein D3C87_2110340 [compost metagenome]
MVMRQQVVLINLGFLIMSLRYVNKPRCFLQVHRYFWLPRVKLLPRRNWVERKCTLKLPEPLNIWQKMMPMVFDLHVKFLSI